MAAVTVTGLVLAVENGSAPMPYFWLFAIAAIVCTVLVEPRGLFLTVAPLPLYFVACAVFIGWLTSPANTRGGTKTKLITAIYPAVEHFLWLLFPFLICVGIAVFRWRRFHRDATSKAQQATEQRRRRRAADESNRSAYERSRTRTVDELLSAAEERRARRAAREEGEEHEELVARPERDDREAAQPRSWQSDFAEARPIRGEQGRTERRSANHGRHSADQRFPSQDAQPGSHSTRVVSGIPEVRRERASRRSVSPLPPRSTESSGAPRHDGSTFGSQGARSEARHSADSARHAQSAHDGRAGLGAREPRNTASARDTADARDAWAGQPYGRHSRPGQRYRPVSKKPYSDSEFRLTDD